MESPVLVYLTLDKRVMATPTTLGSVDRVGPSEAQEYSGDSGDSVTELEYLYEVRAVSNFMSEEPEDLSFSKDAILYVIDDSRKDGWLLAYNEEGDQGLVPGNYVVTEGEEGGGEGTEDEGVSREQQSGADLWKKVRSYVAPDAFKLALKGLGIELPAGFRESALAKFHTSPEHMLSSRFRPKLSLTGLSFRDPCRKSTRFPALEKEISILYASNVPDVEGQLEGVKRCVRLCVYDKRTGVVSNVLSLPADTSTGDKKTWKLSKSELSKDLIFSVKRADSNLELVLELGVSYKKESTQHELGSGWTSLSLFQQNLQAGLVNRTYGLKLHGGKLFDRGVDLDPTLNPTSKKSIFSINRKPTLFVRISPIARSSKDLAINLPDDVIIHRAYLSLTHRYQQLASQILECSTLNLTSPEIYVFLTAIDKPLLMETVVQVWNVINKKKLQRVNEMVQNQVFSEFLLQKVYPLIVSPQLEGQLSKQNLVEVLSGENESDSLLLSQNCLFTPFNISETLIHFNT